MQVTLYRGAEEFSAELAIDSETGEIGGDYPLDVLVKRNPIGTCAWILNAEAQADMVDRHMKAMQAKLYAINANIARARHSLKEVMQATGALSIASNDGTFKATLSPGRDESVDVFDPLQLPIGYMVTPLPPPDRPDKALIKYVLKAGKDVPGARLVSKDRLTIK